ncbi:MAG: diguanylate cyclase, partial [Clostridiales bacterium]|nr:diguanylate cyclase [Clostridiales bacterium]
MFKYIVKRILISIVILLGVSIILYTLVRMMPSDFVEQKYREQILTGKITAEQLAAFKSMYGVGDNSFFGIIGGYFKWLGNLCKGDLGRSFKYKKPVGTVIGENMWIS